jgi:hypothetical protein
MFGKMLLDFRWTAAVVAAAALAELATRILLGGVVTWCFPRGDRHLLVRSRLLLLVTVLLGLAFYRHLQTIYLHDPFFSGLFTFLASFFPFFYLASLASVLAARLEGGDALSRPTVAPLLTAAILLGALFLLRPQVSILGAFAGAAALLPSRFPGRLSRRGRLLAALIAALLLFALLTWLS